jgi:hypothetical protein
MATATATAAEWPLARACAAVKREEEEYWGR